MNRPYVLSTVPMSSPGAPRENQGIRYARRERGQTSAPLLPTNEHATHDLATDPAEPKQFPRVPLETGVVGATVPGRPLWNQ